MANRSPIHSEDADALNRARDYGVKNSLMSGALVAWFGNDFTPSALRLSRSVLSC